MIRAFKLRTLLWLAASLPACAVPEPAENLLRNPGFEAVREGQIADWTIPSYWSGEASLSDTGAHGGRRALRLKAVDKQGRQWARTYSGTYPAGTGLRYTLAVHAKGTGNLKLGVIEYIPAKDGQPPYRYVWQPQAAPLTAEWQQYRFDLPPLAAEVRNLAPIFEIEGPGATAELDDALFAALREPGARLVAEPPYAMVAPGDSVTLQLTASAAGRAWTTGAVRLAATAETPTGAPAEAALLPAELPLAADGTARYTCQIPAASAPGLLRLNLLHPELGVATSAYLDVVPPETKAAFAAAAKRVAAVGEHWLFLGDSLTDFLRGYNYVDQINYWLRETQGEGFTVRNAGVGGDYITRVWQRLNGDKAVHRLNMYDGLYEPKPSRIFIFLGHNDSKQSSASDFVNPLVAPADFEQQYRQTIEKLKSETGARITLLSATSSVFEITQANAERTRAAGRPASLFGRPEMLEQFNAIARRVASELGTGYVDLYEPTRSHADKPSLFTGDGVHMTLAGNHLVALRVLESLAP